MERVLSNFERGPREGVSKGPQAQVKWNSSDSKVFLVAISYQAKIDLIVAGLGQIETAEKRIKSLLRESRKLQRGGIAQRGTAALAATTRGSSAVASSG